MIAEVCRQIREWNRLGIPSVKIAINLSPEQLRLPNYVDSVQEIIGAGGTGADRIMFEITEAVAMKDVALSVNVIRQFHRFASILVLTILELATQAWLISSSCVFSN